MFLHTLKKWLPLKSIFNFEEVHSKNNIEHKDKLAVRLCRLFFKRMNCENKKEVTNSGSHLQ